MNKTTTQLRSFVSLPWLRIVDTMVLVGLGGITFLGSVDHVLTLAREHGQTGHNAFAIAGSLEILAAYVGLEVRRRKGAGRILPIGLLLVAIAFIMWANVMSTPDRSGTGIALALAAPTAFFALALVAETRHWRAPRRRVRTAKPRILPKAQPRQKASQTAANAVREALRDEWFMRRNTAEAMSDAEIATRLGIKPKSAADARRSWERALSPKI